MWVMEERRVVEDFDALTREEFAALRAEDAGRPLVLMYRTEYARWEPDADEPETLNVTAVVWDLVEKPCECGGDVPVYDPDDPGGGCVCDSIADALGSVLSDWDVHATSMWEASASPWDAADETLWAEATETYEYETDTRFRYSVHVKGVEPRVRGEIFAALGVK